MRKLIQGIVEFSERLLPQYAQRFRELAGGQAPDTLFITCADSRVEPNLLVSTEPGELFTMRNVGNLVPPSAADGLSTGDVSEASAIEYALLVLEVPNIVICGHSGCGAMAAVLEGKYPAGAPNLERWLQHAQGASALAAAGGRDAGLDPQDQLSRLNVLLQMEHLRTYPAVRKRLQAGTLRIAGWWFDIATGGMYSYEEDVGEFRPIERSLGLRLMERLSER